jgi:hypothetical protein
MVNFTAKRALSESQRNQPALFLIRLKMAAGYSDIFRERHTSCHHLERAAVRGIEHIKAEQRL